MFISKGGFRFYLAEASSIKGEEIENRESSCASCRIPNQYTLLNELISSPQITAVITEHLSWSDLR